MICAETIYLSLYHREKSSGEDDAVRQIDGYDWRYRGSGTDFARLLPAPSNVDKNPIWRYTVKLTKIYVIGFGRRAKRHFSNRKFFIFTKCLGDFTPTRIHHRLPVDLTPLVLRLPGVVGWSEPGGPGLGIMREGGGVGRLSRPSTRSRDTRPVRTQIAGRAAFSPGFTLKCAAPPTGRAVS